MYLQTKKVVIIFIVMVITFLSIINSLYRETQNTIPQISVVSSEELSFNVSFAQNITDGFSVTDNEQQQLARYGSSLYQISSSSSAQFTNIVSSSDMIVVIGDTFNEFIENVINENPDKQFVLIENSIVYDKDNVYQININYSQVYEAINRVSNENEKSLVIVTNEYSNLAENQYYESEIAVNPYVKLEVVNSTADVVSLTDALNKDFDNGFTNIYSLDAYNNQTIIDSASQYSKEKQKSNITTSELSSEVDSELNSEVDSEATLKEVIEVNDITFKYLDLTQNEYLSDNELIESIGYKYDVKNRITSLINTTIDDTLMSGNIVVSIKN